MIMYTDYVKRCQLFLYLEGLQLLISKQKHCYKILDFVLFSLRFVHISRSLEVISCKILS